eukprot:CAMPEP_0202896280 /NCGR_PEP_ID=MMETSP1392-20130828/5311_1 /ASSEMBLY_ACC=CAM_ASM_000868 /TAXON_ID=225041 /ORGANISM="Chlamydomonas chlamydogama, Strain SAG 11-48b" /LENGTH=63 /DNA_ID=CAMNT_0049581571 /DNA_START=75 /DNA_END=263 /DNA_ORIENTATION=-
MYQDSTLKHAQLMELHVPHSSALSGATWDDLPKQQHSSDRQPRAGATAAAGAGTPGAAPDAAE